MGNTKKHISVFQSCKSRAFQEFYLPTWATSLGPSRCHRETSSGSWLCVRRRTVSIQLANRVQMTKVKSQLQIERPHDPVFQEVLTPAYCSKVIINSALLRSHTRPTFWDKFWGHPTSKRRIVGVLRKMHVIPKGKTIKASGQKEIQRRCWETNATSQEPVPDQGRGVSTVWRKRGPRRRQEPQPQCGAPGDGGERRLESCAGAPTSYREH